MWSEQAVTSFVGSDLTLGTKVNASLRKMLNFLAGSEKKT